MLGSSRDVFEVVLKRKQGFRHSRKSAKRGEKALGLRAFGTNPEVALQTPKPENFEDIKKRLKSAFFLSLNFSGLWGL